MSVKEIMTTDVITVSPQTSLKALGSIFKEKRISGVPVVDANNNIIGIVTLTDLLKILGQIYKWKILEKRVTGMKLSGMYEDEKQKSKVGDIMNRSIYTVTPDASIDDVTALMFSHSVHTIPVVEDGRLVGIIGKRDIVEACF